MKETLSVARNQAFLENFLFFWTISFSDTWFWRSEKFFSVALQLRYHSELENGCVKQGISLTIYRICTYATTLRYTLKTEWCWKIESYQIWRCSDLYLTRKWNSSYSLVRSIAWILDDIWGDFFLITQVLNSEPCGASYLFLKY